MTPDMAEDEILRALCKTGMGVDRAEALLAVYVADNHLAMVENEARTTERFHLKSLWGWQRKPALAILNRTMKAASILAARAWEDWKRFEKSTPVETFDSLMRDLKELAEGWARELEAHMVDLPPDRFLFRQEEMLLKVCAILDTIEADGVKHRESFPLAVTSFGVVAKWCPNDCATCHQPGCECDSCQTTHKIDPPVHEVDEALLAIWMHLDKEQRLAFEEAPEEEKPNHIYRHAQVLEKYLDRTYRTPREQR